MLQTLILAVALAGQCQPGQACYRGGYTYAPQMQCASGSCYLPQAQYTAPYIPPQPAPALQPSVLRPVPPSPYRSAAPAAASPSVAEVDRKIDALAKKVDVLATVRSSGACTCGPDCKCTCGCAGGRVASSAPPAGVTAFRFQ